MASERGSGFNRPATSNDDEALNTALPSRPTSQTPAQIAGSAGFAGQGSSLSPNNPSTSAGAADSRPQVNTPEHIPSPSDVEQGYGGYSPSTSKPEVRRASTGASQGLGAGLPIPAPSAQSPRPRSGFSTHSQAADPFVGSPDRSPTRSNEENSHHSRSHGSLVPSASGAVHASPVGQARYDANEGYGARLRHALEGERDNIVNRLTSTQPQTNQPIGSQMRHLLDDGRDRLVERIPGAYVRDSQNPQGSPSGHLREVIAEERGILIDQIPGGSHHEHPQGQPPNEGFGSRLRHAAEDYFHDTFPSYRLPTIPGRVFNPSGGARAHDRNGQSVLDHVVPISHPDDEKGQITHAAGSVSARLSATLKDAQSERDKYAEKAKFTGLALNVAIGLQVLLGSLTTGLSAVATQGKSAAVSTTILGALSTVVASYLARARGSNEPELSITRVKDLEQFIRECKNFENDHGEDMTTAYDDEIERLRNKFESLLGNANGERKLSSTGGALTR